MRFSIALLTALALAGPTSAKAVEDRPDSANAIMPGCRATWSNQYNDQLETIWLNTRHTQQADAANQSSLAKFKEFMAQQGRPKLSQEELAKLYAQFQ